MSREFAEILLREHYIDKRKLDEAEKHVKETGEPYLKFLSNKGYVDEKRLVSSFAKRYSLTVVDLEKYPISDEVRKLIPRDLIAKYRVLPLQKNKNTLVVATYDPTVLALLDDLRVRLKLSLHAVFTSPTSYFKSLESNFGAKITDAFSDIATGEIDVSETDEEESGAIDITAEGSEDDAPVIKFVNSVLVDALKKGASDIHIEPYEKVFRVRFRVDGTLMEITRVPPKLKNAVLSRLKIISRLDIAEKRLPQDGRIKLKIGKKDVDFRVSTVPVLWGEKAVLRVIDQSNLNLDMGALGFEKSQLDAFKRGIDAPYGMVLVTGPTGSGKTTTLYSALAELNQISENLSTIEDPIEYNLEGINQCQAQAEIDFTFAMALRAFLRQDPDTILLGEIRDLETSEVAIQAALTGHLLLSTLHTNDAPSTIARLLNMGTQPVMLTSALNTIVAQRLIRRLCKDCREPHNPPAEALSELGITKESAAKMQLFQAKGCNVCGGSGYKGRMAIHEVMEMTHDMKEAVLAGATTPVLKRQAMKDGMKTLRMSALLKAARGDTSLEEALGNTAAD